MLSDDDDDFQPFALPDFGVDIPFINDVLAFPLMIHDQLIIGHPDGEHLVELVPINAIPLGDGEVDDIAILDIPSHVVSVIDISSDSDPDSIAGSFESVTSLALLAAGGRAYPTDDDDDALSVAPSSLFHAPTPPLVHDHIPDPVTAPIDIPPIAPIISQPPPVAFVPPIPGSSLPPFSIDAHRVDLPAIFQHEIPAPRPGECTLGQPPSFDPFSSASFMPAPYFTSFEADPHCQSPRFFAPYSMPISDPYHPSHRDRYTRDDLLLSLQLQFEILSRRVLELECEADSRQPPPPSLPPPVAPPPLSYPHPIFPSSVSIPIEGFNARFLTAEQQISFLVCCVHELEDELAHLRSLIFFPPPPPPAI
ncbi:hypothetical protein Hanom_Chr14g01256801 [Helianthus anomalus]